MGGVERGKGETAHHVSGKHHELARWVLKLRGTTPLLLLPAEMRTLLRFAFGHMKIRVMHCQAPPMRKMCVVPRSWHVVCCQHVLHQASFKWDDTSRPIAAYHKVPPLAYANDYMAKE